jgi:acyl-lipid omega-6 desaturase (Delta-12 desaturase)
MFGIGPAYLFLLQHRIPVGLMRKGWQPWASAMATNVAIALIVAVLTWFIGIKAFLLVQLPITLLAATAGVWLFYVQHQFEQTTWERDERWDLRRSALYGSSHYDLPAPLRWFTADIGIHLVHHLCSRIPHYRLSRVAFGVYGLHYGTRRSAAWCRSVKSECPPPASRVRDPEFVDRGLEKSPLIRRNA